MDRDRTDAEAPRNPAAETFESILGQHLARRAVLRGAATVPALALSGSVLLGPDDAEARLRLVTEADGALNFTSVAENRADQVTVPPGYAANVLIRWGDPLFPGMAAFNVNVQTPEDQARRFGFNTDMIALFPERLGAPARVGGLSYPSYLMCVNHEYTTATNMFPDFVTGAVPARNNALTEIEAHGISVVRVQLTNGAWSYDQGSRFNRRITGSTAFAITGPAAGHALLKTPADSTGTRVLGTFNNCAGGFTPWGTYLSAEENFNQYFANGGTIANASIRADHADLGVATGATERRWELYEPRFDLGKAEGVNEPFRFGYIVEVDPYDPTSTPKKRTALGRFKHEAAQVALTATNKVVAYTGDDERFEYVYKFVASGTYNASNRDANMNLLDSGTLYAARFNADGTGIWLALDLSNAGTGPALAAATYADGSRRFPTQAEIHINTRRAADAVGATPMDRPEDIECRRNESFVGTGKVYVVLTNNSQRAVAATAPRGRSSAVDAANPRRANPAGHIIEITEANNDNAATSFTWRFFLLAGDPTAAAGATTDVQGTFIGDRFGAPDNITFDNYNNLWIATDGNPNVFPFNDGIYVAPLGTPAGRPVPVKRFLTGPAGCELCGPLLTPDNTTFFCAIQHPGEDAQGVTSNSQSKWPNGDYPRPAVVTVRRPDGGRLGS